MAKEKSAAVKYLEKLRGGPLTLGALVRSIRETDEHTLEDLANRLGVSRSHLCDIEKGRRVVSAERAARWARTWAGEYTTRSPCGHFTVSDVTDPNATGSVHEPVTYKPAFSNAVDLGTLPPSDLSAIVVQIGEIAHSIDAIPRQSAMWRSIKGASLTATIKGWRVQYEVDEEHEKVVVLSVSK